MTSSTFLAWASEPKMEERKRIGFGVMIFLVSLRAAVSPPIARSGQTRIDCHVVLRLFGAIPARSAMRVQDDRRSERPPPRDRFARLAPLH